MPDRINELQAEFLEIIDSQPFDAGVNAGLDFEIRRFVVGIEAEYGLPGLRGQGISCTTSTTR